MYKCYNCCRLWWKGYVAAAAEVVLTQWPNVWKIQSTAPSVPVVANNDPLQPLVEFCNRVATLGVDNTILDFANQFVVGKCDGVGPTLLKVADELRGVLPAKVGTVFNSIQSYHSLLQTMDQIHAGQVAGALHCPALLRNCCDLVANVSEL